MTDHFLFPIDQSWKKWLVNTLVNNFLFLPLRQKEAFPHMTFQ